MGGGRGKKEGGDKQAVGQGVKKEISNVGAPGEGGSPNRMGFLARKRFSS